MRINNEVVFFQGSAACRGVRRRERKGMKMSGLNSASAVSRRAFVGAAGAAALDAAFLAPVAAHAAEGDAAQQVFSATEASMKGDIEVFVTLEGDAIVRVDVLDVVDSPVIRDAAIDSICARVVEQQNIEVDTVAGATVTSSAVLRGISDALEAAGVDTTPFQKGSDATASKDKADDEEFDLVVVGSGMAGMAAAIAAGREGASVLVLEKLAYVGGSTRVCGGGLWAMGSQANERVGADCSAEDYISFMSDWSAPSELNTDLMNNIHDVSGETFDYLYDWGLPVTASGYTLGNPQAKLTCFWSTAGVGSAWETGASGVADFMATRAEQDGAEIRTNSKVTGLVVEDGAVKGVEVEDLTSTYTVHAKQVVLACGGFTRNSDLIEQYAPDYTDAFAFTGAGSTGEGLAMAQELGAQVVGEGMMGLFGLNPGLGYYGEFGNLVWHTPITVNAQGELFGMEDAFYGKTLRLLLDQDGACGYGIADATSDVAERFEKATDAGLVSKYDTLAELADDQGIDADALAKTAEGAGVSQAPFYCVVKRPLFIGSIPGLKVDADCAVLDADGQPIEGLHAAGELIFGNVFDNAYPCSGTGVGTSCYTGTIAGRAVLAAM